MLMTGCQVVLRLAVIPLVLQVEGVPRGDLQPYGGPQLFNEQSPKAMKVHTCPFRESWIPLPRDIPSSLHQLVHHCHRCAVLEYAALS